MKVNLPYGRQGLEVALPDQAQVLLPERVPALARPQEAVLPTLAAASRMGALGPSTW